jgi:Astacin (Peptidase family M12A)
MIKMKVAGQGGNIRHKLQQFALVLTLGLAACNQPVQIENKAATTALPSGIKTQYPGDLPVTELHSGGINALSLTDTSKLTQSGWVKHTFSDGKSILLINTHGVAVYQDIIITTTDNLPRYVEDIEQGIADARSKLKGQSLGLYPAGCSEKNFFWCTWSTKEYMWPQKTVYYNIPTLAENPTLGFTDYEIYFLKLWIDRWNGDNTVVKWKPVTYNSATPNVRFQPINDDANCGYSSIGYQARKSRANILQISRTNNDACFRDPQTINHEMGHTVGLFHEQDRCDRDNFVTMPVQSTRQCGNDETYYGKFDYSSIMLYQSPSVYGKAGVLPGTYIGVYPIDAQHTIPRNGVLTQTDLSTINGMYNSPANPY